MAPLSIIAEDNPPVFYLLNTYAQMCGFQTLHITVGERVLEAALQERPAYILLNIDLPGKVRGWEALECLKKDEFLQQIPVVVYDTDAEKDDCLSKELADACLPIPVLFDGFKDTLTRVGVKINRADGSAQSERERRSSRRKKNKHLDE
jgi:CheY-like chemotaxis protein